MKKFTFTIDNNKYEVLVNNVENDVVQIDVNGTPFTVKIEKEIAADISAVKSGVNKVVTIETPTTGKATITPIKSPLPGAVVKVNASVGQKVKKGDTLLVIESMKMENNILADKDGTVKAIAVTAGQNVMQGDLLIDFEGSVEHVTPTAIATPKVETQKGTSLVTSPLPGTILRVVATAGQSVKRGDTVVVIESMKMENNIMAEKNGVIKAIHVEAGKNIMQGDPLFELETM
ncbi:MAG: biotin/lipoyl-binding protein [Bacteroidales bacterium]|jgi:biotin carboxyl carrier protein|nr:biotin/lipoyl-binding protein [Bacteroidales bacterium]